METLITLATIALAGYLILQLFVGLVFVFTWLNNRRDD